LLRDITELQKRQNEEAKDIEITLKELTDMLEEMLLLEPSLSSLKNLQRNDRGTKVIPETLPIIALAHQGL
jgi:hypothetical protein